MLNAFQAFLKIEADFNATKILFHVFLIGSLVLALMFRLIVHFDFLLRSM